MASPLAKRLYPAVALALLAAAAGPSRAAAPPSAAAAKEPGERFDVMEYRVLGNSRLPVRSVETAVYPFLGPNQDLGAVQQAAEALAKAYHDAGYGTVFVDVPEQRIGDDGVVRLRVTEGKLDRVRVVGTRYFSNRAILAALPALTPGTTPNLPQLQQQLSALNAQTGDRSVTPVLKAGPEPGTVDVDLNVHDNLPLHASVEVNDRYTANTTPNRLALAASYDNLWQLNHVLSLQYQTAPARTADAEVEAASYLIRPLEPGPMWAVSVIHTNSDVATFGTLGVLGKGSIYGVRWIDPVVNTAATSDSFTLGLDYKDFMEDVALSGSPGLESPVRYLHWSAEYSGAWRSAARTLSLTTSLGFGVRDVVNKPDEFATRRSGAPPNYLYLRSNGQLLQQLPGGFAVLVRFTGQYSPTPLIDDEQLALGGLDTVRGYLEAEALGDEAAAGTVELHSPGLGPRAGRDLQPLYAFVFVDEGVVGLEEPLSHQAYWTHLASTGAGLRLENGTGLTGSLDYALPLVTGPFTRRGDPRVDFSIRYGF